MSIGMGSLFHPWQALTTWYVGQIVLAGKEVFEQGPLAVTFGQDVGQGLSDSAPLYAYVNLRATSPAGPTRVPVGFSVSPRAAGVLGAASVLDVPAEGSATWAVRVPCPASTGDMVEDICPCDVTAAVLAAADEGS